MKKYLKEEQVAEILGVKPSTISHHRCTKQKQWSDLEYVKIGGVILYEEEKFYEWLENHTKNQKE